MNKKLLYINYFGLVLLGIFVIPLQEGYEAQHGLLFGLIFGVIGVGCIYKIWRR